jgi:NifU-like protein
MPAADVALAEAAPAPALSPAKEAILVARIIEEMRPGFQADGGNVELVDIQGARVLVRLGGACAACQLVGHTLGGLQEKIIETLGRPVRVMPVAKV